VEVWSYSICLVLLLVQA